MTRSRHFRSPAGWIRRVPHGFSWFAFFFGALWAFANRGWRLGLLLVLAELPLHVLTELLDVRGFVPAAIGFGVSIAVMFVIGRFGHRWLAWSLRRQGYEEIAGTAR